MKKLVVLLFVSLFLAACGSNEEVSKGTESVEEITIEKTVEKEKLSQEELNKKIKEEAVQAAEVGSEMIIENVKPTSNPTQGLGVLKY